MIAFGAVIEKIPIASFRSETIMSSNRFQQSRFSRAVLARKETNPRMQCQFFQLCDRWDGEGIARPVIYAFRK